MLNSVSVSVAEDVQPIPKISKNGRVYSQSMGAIWARHYRKMNSPLVATQNAQGRELKKKKRALKHAILVAEHSANFPGAFFS